MSAKISTCNCNRVHGISLVEMLVSVVIIGIISAGTAEMLFMNTQGSWKLFNKVDSLNGARLVIDRIAMTVRQARNIGDIYGETVDLDGDSVDVGTNYFPAPNNPLFGDSAHGLAQTPTGGWPTSPWPARPYVLSNQTLVVQIPVFDGTGYPTKIAKDIYGANKPSTDLDNVDTYVYQVLADTNDPGTFMIQEASFLGVGSAKPLLNPPRTILRGIIGPLDPATNLPRTFQYLDRTDATGTPLNTVGSGGSTVTLISNYTGVVVNFELRRHESVQTRNRTTMGIKSEIFMRNNTLATIQGN